MLVLAAGAVWLIDEVVHSCGPIRSGVDKVDGECVGVTDGSYVFHHELARVQRLIAEENADVRANSSSYVTVAVLNLLTPTETSATSAEQVRGQLKGAYTAQRRLNEMHAADKSFPQVQVVLANQGNTLDQWQPVKDQLVAMSEEENHPLVAVIGLGVSTEDTRQRAIDLSEQGIAMVGAIITGQGLDHSHIEGLIRVSPSNQDYVEALRAYLDTLKPLPSAMLVFDSNSAFRGDIFTGTLKRGLERRMGDLIKFPSQSFVGQSIPTDIDPGNFTAISNSICAAKPDVVFYAGREVDLNGFLQSLEGRPCRQTPLTVLTGGSDIGSLLEQREREQRLGPANLTVLFAATTYPEGWARQADGTPEGYPEFLTAFKSHKFDIGNLDNGGAIMMHDALLAAVEAVERAVTEGRPATVGNVRSELLNLNLLHRVQGASGTLSFNSTSTGAGNPIGKPIPVLQYPKPADSPFRQTAPLYVTR
ncbi:MAG: hypothetical protein ACRDTE_09425 [Pseudonocardiaceae bacterium]